MRFYCLVSFWSILAGMFFRMIYIVNNDYPRTTTYSSAAEDLMWLIGSGCFLYWIAHVLDFI